MHQVRNTLSKRIPIKRKGTKYVVRASSHLNSSVPVLVAVRDMLKLARTSKEVKQMVHKRMLKVNGRLVKDYHEGIKLFNIFEAGKSYKLTILPTGKFSLDETKDKEGICKVTSRKLVRGGKIQFNLHDGTNIISDKKIGINDTIYIDFSSKIKSHVPFSEAKGKEAFIFSGKYAGSSGKISSVEGKIIEINLGKGENVKINSSHAIII